MATQNVHRYYYSFISLLEKYCAFDACLSGIDRNEVIGSRLLLHKRPFLAHIQATHKPSMLLQYRKSGKKWRCDNINLLLKWFRSQRIFTYCSAAPRLPHDIMCDTVTLYHVGTDTIHNTHMYGIFFLSTLVVRRFFFVRLRMELFDLLAGGHTEIGRLWFLLSYYRCSCSHVDVFVVYVFGIASAHTRANTRHESIVLWKTIASNNNKACEQYFVTISAYAAAVAAASEQNKCK